MKISCLIAAYKAGNYIEKALLSIEAQEHRDWEIVVVEDGSRDETEAIVRRFAARTSQSVRYDNYGVNRGVATARNRLLELAAGDAVAFLDADDWWTPQHLGNAATAFDRGADVAISRIQLFDLDANKPMETYAPGADLFTAPVRVLFERSAIMTSSCVALKRSAAQKAGTFDPAFRIGEDRDYWMRCAAEGAHFADTGSVTCFYSKHATSTMAKTQLWAQQEVAFYEKHRGLTQVPETRRRSLLAHALVNQGRLLRAADPESSARVLALAWRLKPFSGSTGVQWALSKMRALRASN